MELLPDIRFVTKMNNQELRLVGLALALKIKPGSKEAQQAQELNLLILKNRAAILNDLAHVANGALERALKDADPLKELETTEKAAE